MITQCGNLLSPNFFQRNLVILYLHCKRNIFQVREKFSFFHTVPNTKADHHHHNDEYRKEKAFSREIIRAQLTRPYIGSLLLTNIPKRTRPLEALHHSLVLVVLLLREDSYTHIPCDNPKKIEN